MKWIIVLLIISSLNLSAEQENRDIFDVEMESLYTLVERSLVQRSQSPAFFDELNTELESSGYLSAQSIQKIKKRTEDYKTLRSALLKKALLFEPWLKEKKLDEKRRFKGVMLSLSSAIVLYDNYLFNLSAMQSERHLRHVINDADSEYNLESRELLLITSEYTSIGNYIRMQKAIQFYQRELEQEYEYDDEMVYLQTLIENSPSYRAQEDKNFFQVVARKLYFYGKSSVDEVELFRDDSINLMSGVFGNGMGLISTRRGLMYTNNTAETALRQEMKAGDILLEKTPFRLTDKFIPGYWGHAAIWIGSKEELKELGIWDEPIIVPYHKQIEEGRQIVEALRSGVELNSLKHFLNIDDMAVLRESAIDVKKRKAIILRAFAQLGKAYDFNFDVETTDKIVCSELVYICYTHIKWPTSKTLGRYTVSPDHIAHKTESNELKLISLYYKGKEIDHSEGLWKKMLIDKI
ncbi:YiiX/YebB-like N1pC/P60 family cysteine hydrolase [Sulfurovum sp.]|uniref:YiiX/YebB-like N1pC/P60 family cysteine hydrolase n=1 Tax=Sulfurovum sp. TaxID=1969726 RepID=UPI003564610B